MKALDPKKTYDLPKPKNRIEELLWQLSDAHSAWVMTSNPEYIKQYHDAYHALRALGWNGGLDIDEELPDELMPQAYLDETAESRILFTEQTATLTAKYPPVKQSPTHSLLVVENRFDLRERISTVLRDFGYAVIDVADAARTLVQISEPGPYLPALIVLDLSLPDMSPSEILAAIRQQAPDVPIIALSDPSRPPDPSALTAAGVADHLIKPTNWAKLLLAIVERVDRQLQPRDLS